MDAGTAPPAAPSAAVTACYDGSATAILAMHPFDPMAPSPPEGLSVPGGSLSSASWAISAASPGSAVSTTSPASVGSVFDPGPASGSISTSTNTLPNADDQGLGIGGQDRDDGRTSSFSSVAATATGSSPATAATPTPGAAAANGAQGTSSSSSAKEIELQRKRARDRKSQQAMRDRTKWTIANLNEQVAFLNQVLSARVRDVNLINTRLQSLEVENAQLRTQNAALQLSLMGSGSRVHGPGDPAVAATGDPTVVAGTPPGVVPGTGARPDEDGALADGVAPATALSLADAALVKSPWEIPPMDGPPTCLSDQILQGFIAAKVQERPVDGSAAIRLKPNVCSLLEKDRRTSDPISDVVGDIIRTYFEIDTMPKQVAVFYIMCTLLKWMTLLDKASWDRLPVWLRPTWAQITTPHAAWIDRIPWPNVRNYLIGHPNITLDHFAAVYSTSFGVRWPYDHSHVLIPATTPGEDVCINPVYEEHILQLSNWEVGKAFRDRYPEIALIVDSDADQLSLYDAEANDTQKIL